MIAWVLPPFRHFGRSYFVFFLVLALMDPTVFIINTFSNFDPMRIHSLTLYILWLSIIDLQNLKKYYMIYLVGGLLLVSCSFFLSIQINVLLILVLLLLILLILIKKLIIDINRILIIDNFNIALVFYIVTLIMKVLYYLFTSQHNIVFFYLTTAFEILFAIFFTIFHDNDKRLQIKLSRRRETINT